MKSALNHLALSLAVIASISVAAQDAQPMLDQKAPAFELSATDGKTYSLGQVKGQYVVIHFAATWCPFCNAEAPYLEQLHKQYKDKGVTVFIIDVMEDQERVQKSFAKFNFSFPVLLDVDGKVAARYAPADVQPDLERHEVPIASNLIIDPEGNIRFYSLLNSAEFDARLNKLQEKLNELLQPQE